MNLWLKTMFVLFHSLCRGLGALGLKGLEPNDYSYSLRTRFSAMGPTYFAESENGIKEEGDLMVSP